MKVVNVNFCFVEKWVMAWIVYEEEIFRYRENMKETFYGIPLREAECVAIIGINGLRL